MSARDVIDLTLFGRGYDRTEGTSDAILAALAAAGLVVVPKEPTIEMIQAGCDAARASRSTGISGMTIEAQTRNLAHREIAAYRAMVAAAQEDKP